jgi:hypothetical protein
VLELMEKRCPDQSQAILALSLALASQLVDVNPEPFLDLVRKLQAAFVKLEAS